MFIFRAIAQRQSNREANGYVNLESPIALVMIEMMINGVDALSLLSTAR